jgi:hypothetical protein
VSYVLRGATDVDTTGGIASVAEVPGSAPCRRCLRDAEPGEEVTLVSYDPFSVSSPYRSASPVYVHSTPCRPYVGHEIPDQQRRRLLSVRSFDGSAMMLESEVVEGTGLQPLLEAWFADPRTSFVHVHNARPGCFAVRVERSA